MKYCYFTNLLTISLQVTTEPQWPSVLLLNAFFPFFQCFDQILHGKTFWTCWYIKHVNVFIKMLHIVAQCHKFIVGKQWIM